MNNNTIRQNLDLLVACANNNYFSTDIPCKIIKSFDYINGYDLNIRFKQFPDKELLLISMGLNTDHDIKYHYYYCNNDFIYNDTVIFYHIERLDLFIQILQSNGINYTKEEILQIPCEYDHKRPIIETLIIAMLYGNIYPCKSLYFQQKPFNIDDPLFQETDELKALQRSYKLFIEGKVNKWNKNNIERRFQTINYIEKND